MTLKDIAPDDLRYGTSRKTPKSSIGICVISMSVVSLLAGCVGGGPAEWAEHLMLAECGTSPQELQALSGREVHELDSPDGWKTHFISDGETVVWFGFEKEKLRYYQPTWPVKDKMAQYTLFDLCQNRFIYESG